MCLSLTKVSVSMMTRSRAPSGRTRARPAWTSSFHSRQLSSQTPTGFFALQTCPASHSHDTSFSTIVLCTVCKKQFEGKAPNQKTCGDVECLKVLRYANRHRFSRTPKGRFLHSKGHSKRRDIVWTLTLQEYIHITSKPCHYCANRLAKPVETCGGLDRIDISKGYEVDNVVSCCAVCNRLRSDLLTPEEMCAVANLLVELRR